MFYNRFKNGAAPILTQPLLCGKTGIRTLGARKGTTVFETAPIDHSGIFPYITRGRTCRFVGAKVLNDFDVCNIRTCISKLFFLTATPNGLMLALFACLRMPLYDYLIMDHV